MSRIIKIAGTVFALALLIIIFIFAHSLDNQRIISSEDEKDLSKLNLYRMNIIERQKQRISELEAESKGDGHLILLFTEPRAQIYTDIYPISGKTPCNLLINLSDLPGNEGNLTWEEVHSLSNAGWGLCLGWDGSSNIEEYHSQMQQIIADSELPDISSVYLTESCYTDEIKDSLSSLGYSTIIHHGETGEISCTELQNDIWLPGAVGWYIKNSNTMPKAIAYNGGSLVFTIGFTYNDEIYSQSRFKNLIERTDYYSEVYQLSVCSIESAYEYYKTLTYESFDMNNDAALIAMQKELDKINQQISELEESIKKNNAIK